jgi:RNA recognition motif-containing protein
VPVSEAAAEAGSDAALASEASSDATAASETAAATAGSGNSVAARPGDVETAARSIYMGNIYFDITEDQLKELCSQYGAVENVRLMKDVRGFSRG